MRAKADRRFVNVRRVDGSVSIDGSVMPLESHVHFEIKRNPVEKCLLLYTMFWVGVASLLQPVISEFSMDSPNVPRVACFFAVALAIVAAAWVASAVVLLVHVVMDNADESKYRNIYLLRSMRDFRWHHVEPRTILHSAYIDTLVSGIAVVIAFLYTSILTLAFVAARFPQTFGTTTPPSIFCRVFVAAAATITQHAQLAHRMAHKQNHGGTSALTRMLQHAGISLNPEFHRVHHILEDENYAIILEWLPGISTFESLVLSRFPPRGAWSVESLSALNRKIDEIGRKH